MKTVDGMRITLHVDRQSYGAGDTINARVRIQNVGNKTVRASGSSPERGKCKGPVVWVFADVPGLRAPGRDWPRDLGAIKEAALKSAARPDGTLGERVPPLVPTHGFSSEQQSKSTEACPLVLRSYDWAPGSDATVDMEWDGRLTNQKGEGFVLPSGPIRIRAIWPKHVRNYLESPVNTEVEVDIEGGGPDVVSGGEAVDAALENKRVRDWVRSRFDEDFNATVVYNRDIRWERPKGMTPGPFWVFAANESQEHTSQYVEAFVDGLSGDVRKVNFCGRDENGTPLPQCR